MEDSSATSISVQGQEQSGFLVNTAWCEHRHFITIQLSGIVQVAVRELSMDGRALEGGAAVPEALEDPIELALVGGIHGPDKILEGRTACKAMVIAGCRSESGRPAALTGGFSAPKGHIKGIDGQVKLPRGQDR